MSGSVTIASPVGTEVIKAMNTSSLMTTVTTAQLRDTSGYLLWNEVSQGNTITLGAAFKSVVQISGTATIAAMTLNFPTTPVDGQRLLLFSNETVTALTMNVAAGQTLAAGGITGLTINVAIEYLYSAGNLTWNRIQ